MPRLLTPRAIEGPGTRGRWAAVLAAVIALTAWHTDWAAVWDTTRGLVPAAGDRLGWDRADLAAAPPVDDLAGLAAGIDDPAAAATAHLNAEGLALDLAWEAPLALAAVRVETYTDAYGTGLRLGVAADTTTASGPDCLNARATAGDRTTVLQWCSHAVQHPPVDMAAFLGKEGGGEWAPDRLYLTQTANLTPPEGPGPSLVDYFGFGVATGDAFATGLWSDGMWQGAEHAGACDAPDQRRRLDDLHLTDRYTDPAEHRRDVDIVEDAGPAFPAEDRLLTPACVAVANGMSLHAVAAKPFLTAGPVPMAGVAGYDAATREVLPVRTTAVVDLRTCDTGLAYCTADETGADPELWWVRNDGPGRTWTAELLDLDR